MNKSALIKLFYLLILTQHDFALNVMLYIEPMW